MNQLSIICHIFILCVYILHMYVCVCIYIHMYVYVHFIFKYFSIPLLRKRTFPCTTALPFSCVKKINIDSIISSTIPSIFNAPSRMSFCSHSCFISELNQVFASRLVVLSLSPLQICLFSCFCFPWHWTFRGNQVNCLVVCSTLWTSLMFSSCLDSSYMYESGLVSGGTECRGVILSARGHDDRHQLSPARRRAVVFEITESSSGWYL